MNNRYNDSFNYLTINIINNNGGKDQYVIHFDNIDSMTNKRNYSLSLVYAFDQNGNGGSGGNVHIGANYFIMQHLVEQFEHEFINKIDSVLKKKKY